MKLSLALLLGAIGTLTSALAIDPIDAKALIARQETSSATATTVPTASSAATSNDPNQTDQPASGIYGSDSNSQGANTEAGASGTGTSFNLSTGGLVAIIIVVVAVVLFGAATTTLWVIAKRRQWTMKQTLQRASKRLTGRGGPSRDARDADAAEDRRRRRTGVQMTSRAEQRGQKRGMVIEIKDQEQNAGGAEKSSAGGGLGRKLGRN